MPDRVRVVTWNIHGCMGTDGVLDPERTVRVIRGLAPDVLALQEVDSRRRLATFDVFSYLKEAIGGHSVDGKTISSDDGHYGQKLISRWPLSRECVHDISFADREPRRVLEVHIDSPSGPLRVLATHLGLGSAERRHQFRSLAKILESDVSTPTVLMGDFNECLARGYGYRILSPLFDAGPTHRTFPARFPLLPLDRIWCRAGRLSMRSWTDRSQTRASDHLPVVAELSWQEIPARSHR